MEIGYNIGGFSDDKRRNEPFSVSHSTANEVNPGDLCKINKPIRKTILAGLGSNSHSSGPMYLLLDPPKAADMHSPNASSLQALLNPKRRRACHGNKQPHGVRKHAMAFLQNGCDVVLRLSGADGVGVGAGRVLHTTQHNYYLPL